MTEEARRLSATWSGTTAISWSCSPPTTAIVNADLAPHLQSAGRRRRSSTASPFPAGSERAGLLGQALFLALTAKPDDSSPTARGLFVREQFLCQHVPDPPAGVNTNLPPVTEAKPLTNRDAWPSMPPTRAAPPATT